MKKIKIKLPNYIQILIGMFLGIATGFVLHKLELDKIAIDWIKPFGTIFIKALKMIAIPLVFVSLIKGILGVKNIKELSSMGLKTIGIYILTTFIAVMLGVVAVNVVNPGKFFPQDKSIQFKQQIENAAAQQVNVENSAKDDSPLTFLVDMVPENITSAMGNNSMMLQVIFLAILFGIAILSIGTSKMKSLMDVVDSVNLVLLKVIDFIMKCAPLGVFALMTTLFIDTSGDMDVFASLGVYAATVIGCLLLLIYGVYPLFIHFFSNVKISKFIKSMIPVQLVAFSTSSSAATLPVNMEQCNKELGLSSKSTSFVLPVGVTINMDGTSCYQAISIIFIAQVMGMDLTMAQTISIILLTILSSIGTPGVPGASIVMAVMVLGSIGIPAEGLVLILGIDRPLDMVRTVVNVTGDAAVASIIDKSVSK
ncbi:MAG: dicarboxylate/amino acid:cation symporter [Rikenellaceae bacterium]